MIESLNNKKEFYRYFLSFFIIFIVYYIVSIVHPQQFDTYIATQYITSYDFGFISRGFIGSVLTLIFKEISICHIYFVVSIFNMVMMTLVSYFCAKVLVSSDQKIRFIVLCILLFFCVNPGSITFLFNQKNFGRLELFSIIIMLVSVLIILKQNKLVYLIPILCTISILIYQTAVLLYLPVVFVLLFYLVIKNNDKRYMSVFIVSFSLSCILFIYLQCFGKINQYTPQEAFKKLCEISSFNPNGEYLRAEYYIKVQGHLEMVKSKMPMLLNRLVFSMVLFAPVIYFIYYVFIKSFILAQKKHKIAYFAILVNVLTFVPVFICAVDYGRWLSAIFITQIVLILALIYLKDKAIIDALYGLQLKLEKRKYLVIIVICLYGMISRFTHYEVIPVAKCFDVLSDIISTYFKLAVS